MPHSRPRPVTGAIVCCLLIGMIACVSAASGGVGLVVSAHAVTPRHPSVNSSPGTSADWLRRHPLLLVTVNGVLGTSAVLCGIGIWIRKRLARVGTVVRMSLCAIGWVISGVLTAVSFVPPPGFPAPIRGFVFDAILVVSTFWALIAALPAWLLTRGEGRAWFIENEQPQRPM
jgi:hypothetical protein